MIALSKTIESSALLTPKKSDADQALNTVAAEIIDLINEIGTKGGWYIYDSVVMDVTVTYPKSQDKTLNYDIPINNKADVDRINAVYLRDYTPEQREHQGIHLYHPMEYHIDDFLVKAVDLIRDMYHENNGPTSGQIIVKTTATYEPEDK